MTFDQYLPISIADIFIQGLVGALGTGIFFGGITGLVCLAFRSEGGKKATLSMFLIGAFFGAFFGGFIGGGSVNDDNMRILQTNVSKKYDTQITGMGIKPGTRGSTYDSTDKETHEVTIVVKGKSTLAYLQQDEKTNEPTLLDYDTKQPMQDILKANAEEE